MKIATSIDKTGPFFTHDPAKTFRQNARVMLEAVAAEGQEDVRVQLRAGESTRAPINLLRDRVADHAIGRVRSLSGKRWALTAVISVNNSGFSRREGISLMAAAASVERRFHPFRRTASRLRSARAVNQAELAKGMN